MPNLKVSMISVQIIFQSPPTIVFYTDDISENKMKPLWDKLKEITQKYSPDLTYTNLAKFYKLKDGPYRVEVIAYDKYTVSKIVDLRAKTRYFLEKEAIKLPTRVANVYLIPKEDREKIIEFVNEKINTEIDKLNEHLIQYYQSKDYKELLDIMTKLSLKGIKAKMSLTPLVRYPAVQMFEINYDLSEDNKFREYYLTALKDFLSKYVENIMKKAKKAKKSSTVKNKIKRELLKLEKIGFIGATSLVDELLNQGKTNKIEIANELISKII